MEDINEWPSPRQRQGKVRLRLEVDRDNSGKNQIWNAQNGQGGQKEMKDFWIVHAA
jgi:hypothetical protein